eukprot:12039642-Karenia_brevis.AAC.1
MPDLRYAEQSKAFSDSYARTGGLNFLHSASLVNAARLTPPDPMGPQVGDFFQWPGEQDVFACIIAFAKLGKAHVTPFYRRPLNQDQPCQLHPSGGGCW